MRRCTAAFFCPSQRDRAACDGCALWRVRRKRSRKTTPLTTVEESFSSCYLAGSGARSAGNALFSREARGFPRGNFVFARGSGSARSSGGGTNFSSGDEICPTGRRRAAKARCYLHAIAARCAPSESRDSRLRSTTMRTSVYPGSCARANTTDRRCTIQHIIENR